MTATLTDVREALAAAVGTIAGLLKVYDKVPDSMSAPCAIVQPAPGDFLRFRPTMGDTVADYLMLVTVYVPGADAVNGQVALDPYLAATGASSVTAAVNGTLGGLVSSAVNNYARNYRAETWDEQRYIAVDFPVEVRI
jgi:hypothetical protein